MIVKNGFRQSHKKNSQLKLGQAIYCSVALAKVAQYSRYWGRLDSWWSGSGIGCFALVAFWAAPDEIVDAFGDWSLPWRANQELKRGFALGRAGDANGGLGAAARGFGYRVGVDTSEGIDGGEAASSWCGIAFSVASPSLIIFCSHRRGRGGLQPRRHHRRRPR